MEKEFYLGQPLMVKTTGEKVTFVYDDSGAELPCNIFVKYDGGYHDYEQYEDLEPSTEFTFSQIIAGLEQGYFEVGTKFTVLNSERQTLEVTHGSNGLYLDWCGSFIVLTSVHTNSTWQLVEPRKEMTLEEIEAELGYKIKLKDNGENLNRDSSPD